MVKFFTSKAMKALAISSFVLVAGNAMAQDQERKLYLCDVYTEEALTSDIFGVPMRIDQVGDGQYMARYYNQKVNNEIYFSAKKTDFSDVYGLDAEGLWCSGASLADVNPIILPEAGKYYQIDIDENDGTVAVKTYEVAEYMNPIFYEYGSESLNVWASYLPESEDEYLPAEDSWLQPFLIGTGDRPNNIDLFVQDRDNKNLYMWEKPMALAAGEELNFMIHEVHPAEWWNAISWRVDDSKTCEKVLYFGGVVKKAYLNWAFGADCDWSEWNKSEGYRTNFVPDNWFRPYVQKSGVTCKFLCEKFQG